MELAVNIYSIERFRPQYSGKLGMSLFLGVVHASS